MPDDDAARPTGTIGWGVLAPGGIAHGFVTDLALLPDARLVATGSRSAERARAFAERHGGRAHGSYDALVADPDVDVVYVASPHAFHEEHTLLALEAGKHVLCEKPMTLDAASTERLFAAAQERGLFLMEAMWTACHPLVRAVLARLGTPEHGAARQVVADLGFVVRRDPSDRLLDPALGGGALLDMGVYPVTLAHLVLGEPEQLAATATLDDRGVDTDVAVVGRYAAGALAALTSTMTASSPRTATIATDRGRFELAHDFHAPTQVWWVPDTGEGPDRGGSREPRLVEPVEPVIGVGYGNEAAEVHRCLREGRTSSELVPPAQTISVMRQLDEVRRLVGLQHPAPATT